MVIKARTKKSRLKIKKDLIPEKTDSVTSSLITDESIFFFLNNYDYICNVWVYFLSARATVQSAVDAVIAAFDVLYCVISVRDARLLLRFAYVQLAKAIDFLVNTVSIEQCTGYVRLGYKDESVYINVYLAAKGKPLNDKKLRDELLGYKRISVRLRQLASLSPFLLAVYSDDAELIMCVLLSTSITKLTEHSQNTLISLPTLVSLVVKVGQLYPGLVRLLCNLAQEGERAIRSSARPNVVRDAFARTATELLGLIGD
jgi:hypothetical protein